MKINKIVCNKHNYCAPLASIPNPAEVIYSLGEPPQTRRPSVAIIGTRKPTPYGADVTISLARELASAGVVIISGLAFGIDALAHKAALEVGGTTLAVLASPLPNITPRSHSQLAEQLIAHGGAVISEHIEHDGYVVGKWSFLERNRLVSGLADAILITEASSRSGTLNTAAHALAQGRDVFVVPGNITSPSSVGCNSLIKQGAIPVTSAQDILDVIAPSSSVQHALPLGSTQLETTIIQFINSGIHDGDILLSKSDASAADFTIALTMLELNGAIRPLGANKWSLR